MAISETAAVNPMRELVAEEVRVMLARRRISASALARRLGMTQSYLARRMSGDIAFDVDDLQRIADALNVDVRDLIPATRTLPPRGEHNTLRSSPVAVRPMSKVGPASRKPDNTRPSSPRPRIIPRPLTASK